MQLGSILRCGDIRLCNCKAQDCTSLIGKDLTYVSWLDDSKGDLTHLPRLGQELFTGRSDRRQESNSSESAWVKVDIVHMDIRHEVHQRSFCSRRPPGGDTEQDIDRRVSLKPEEEKHLGCFT